MKFSSFTNFLDFLFQNYYAGCLTTAVLSIGTFLNTFSYAEASYSRDGLFDRYQEKAEKIVSQMTREEKIGQMLLPTFTFLTANRGPDAMQQAQEAWYTVKDPYELGLICGFEAISKYHIGSVIQDAGPLPYSGEDQTFVQWRKVASIANLFYNGPAATNLLLATDSIHGDQHVTGSILFPHNIGIGATHNPNIAEQVGYWTTRNMQTTGFNWSFSPTVAVGYDYRWGRMYESYTQNLSVLKALAFHYVKGMQQIKDKRILGALTSAKHFIADGDTVKGVDEGYTYSRSLEDCWKKNGAGYEGAVDAHTGTIMASYSSLNDIPMHFGGDFDILNKFVHQGIQGQDGKNYRMDGFVVSDYVGVSRAAYKCLLLSDQCNLVNRHDKAKCFDECLKAIKRCQPFKQYCCLCPEEKAALFNLYVRAIAKAVNAGVDVFMIANNAAFLDPFDYEQRPPYTMLSPLYYTTKIKTVVNAIAEAVELGLISEKRFNEAVERIIRVKLSMSQSYLHSLSSSDMAAEAKASLEAAEQSLVLLKNHHSVLPITSNSIKNVFLLGAFDDIGSQNGGWTVTWQGQKGNKYWPEGSFEKQSSHATSILDGVRNILGHKPSYITGEEAVLSSDLKDVNANNSIAIVAVAEPPYAEYNGDIDNGNPWYVRGALMGENIYNSPIQPQFLGVQLTCDQLKAIEHLKQHGVKIVTVLFSGRPVVITEGKEAPLPHSDAFIAAFLPGTSGGQAIANAIFGKYGFKSVKSIVDGKTYYSNTLPFAWPANMEEVESHEYSLFPIEYGLKTEVL